jgi:hypothetical protein
MEYETFLEAAQETAPDAEHYAFVAIQDDGTVSYSCKGSLPHLYKELTTLKEGLFKHFDKEMLEELAKLEDSVHVTQEKILQ